MEVSSVGTAFIGSGTIGTVQIWPAESGGKSWLKEISTGKPRIPSNCSGNDEPHKQKRRLP
jgi:hypothetical protein